MLKTVLLGVLGTFCLTGMTAAAPCPAYTYTLTNGTTADANQVMSNFASILNCANTALAPLANPSFSASLSLQTSTQWTGFSLFNGPNSVAFLANNASGGSQFGMNTTGGTRLVNIDTNGVSFFNGGNVGIGTASPSYTFQVSGSAAGSSAWINLSDARLKSHVEEISGAVDLVTRLRGVRFQWRPATSAEIGADLDLPRDTPQIGFIAQEVQSVVPEAVVAPKSGSDGLYGLKEADLIPVLVQAIKEQQGEIVKLRAAVAGLQAGK